MREQVRTERSQLTESGFDFEKTRQKLLNGPRVTSLLSTFEKIAAGEVQVPRTPVVAAKDFLNDDKERIAFHEVLQKNLGTFLRHGCASIPHLFEELVRVGIAINKLAQTKSSEGSPFFFFYETSSADGTFARTVAEIAAGRILTLTDSPNEANEAEFNRLRRHDYSTFFKGCFAEVTPALLAGRYPHLKEGFDFIWENTTFQMYGAYRDEQIAYVKRLLKPSGVMLFLEKMNHADSCEYDRREIIKDRDFKARYFTEAQIAGKRRDIIETMERGQVELGEFVKTASEQFAHVHLIWNSSNFCHIAASNDARSMGLFLSHLGDPYVPEPFGAEKPCRLA